MSERLKAIQARATFYAEQDDTGRAEELQEAIDAGKAASRQQLGLAYSHLLSVLMDERLEDGTPVLGLVLALRPDLRDRFWAFLEASRV